MTKRQANWCLPKVRKDAHKLIEEFMLLANKRVAMYVYNLNQKPKLRSPLPWFTGCMSHQILLKSTPLQGLPQSWVLK
ncbi:MAG: hypothetical protein IPH28_23290 [Cytophagaceae bacterium]|nr:hypothetical protein [Cytophagaceae bacterium]